MREFEEILAQVQKIQKNQSSYVNNLLLYCRNDALYKAATTSTVRPLVIYTTPAEGLAATPLPAVAGARRPPAAGGGRRRPYRRRRPQYEYYDDEYYDDYYEERPRSRRKRPRPRPRPIYDDEYDEEYEEDRYERRNSRRPSYRRRTKDRRKHEYEDDEVDDRFEDEDFKTNRRNNDDRKKSSHDRDDPKPEKRRPASEEHDRKPYSSRKGSRRPVLDEYEDETVEDSRSHERHRKKEDRKPASKPTDDTRTIIKPVSGTIYDRPRLAPRIKLPVPKNEADKYAYKPLVTQAPTAIADDAEYYDDYEDEPVTKHSKNIRKPTESPKSREDEEKETRKQVPAASRPRYSAKKPKEEERPRPSFSERPKYGRGSTTTRKSKPVIEEYEDDYVEEETKNKNRHKSEAEEPRSREKWRPVGKPETSSTSTTTTTTTSTTTTTTTPPPTKTTTTTTTAPVPYREKPDPIVRIVKRPFLPSRGGNPYSARGLQPVGAKAADKKHEQSTEEAEPPLSEEMETKEGRKQYVNVHKTTTEQKRADEDYEEPSTERPFKPSPVLLKFPVRQKFVATAVAQENYTPTGQSEIRTNYKSKEYTGPRTTQKPKLPDKDPLDLNEYDVTLNDALNPTLPNLPVRGFPTGFSAAHDYTYSNFQRPRYVIDPVLSQASTDYVYQAKPPARQRYDAGTQNNVYRVRATAPQQTQAYYSSF